MHKRALKAGLASKHLSLWAAVAALVPCSIEAQGVRTVLDHMLRADSVQAACAFATERGYPGSQIGSRARRLADFCKLGPPRDAAAANAWTTMPRPSTNDVRLAAQRQELPTVVPPFSPSPQRVISPMQMPGVVQAGAERTALPGFRGATFLPSQGTALVGVTQFVVGRAQETANAYLINLFVDRLCTREETVAPFIPATCALLRADSLSRLLGSGFHLPSWSVFQTVLRRDLDTLPDIIVGRLRSRGIKAYAGVVDQEAARRPADRLAAVLGAARLSSNFLRGRTLPVAFAEAANDAIATVTEICTAGDSARTCRVEWSKWPATRALVTGSSVGAILPPDFLARASTPEGVDTLALYALKSIAIAVEEPIRPGYNSMAVAAVRDAILALQADSPGERASFHAERLWSGIRPTYDTLSSAARMIAGSLEAAGADRGRRFRAYALGLTQAAPFLLARYPAGSASDSLESLLVTATSLVERIAAYPALRLSNRYSELIGDLMTLASTINGPLGDGTFQRAVFPQSAMRALQFALDMSQTTTPDAFQATLERYAAPAGGFARKRARNPEARGNWYWSINAYVGGAIGLERAYAEGVTTSNAMYTGLAIPLGIERGWTMSRRGGIGLMLQLIDVGQVASWRSHQGDDEVVTTPPSLTLASVFAPGAAIMWHAYDTPFTLGVASALVPQFRALANSEDESKPRANVWRVSTFLAVDVPLFP